MKACNRKGLPGKKLPLKREGGSADRNQSHSEVLLRPIKRGKYHGSRNRSPLWAGAYTQKEREHNRGGGEGESKQIAIGIDKIFTKKRLVGLSGVKKRVDRVQKT